MITFIISSKDNVEKLNRTLHNIGELTSIEEVSTHVVVTVSESNYKDVADVLSKYQSVNFSSFQVLQGEYPNTFAAFAHGLKCTKTNYVMFMHAGDTFDDSSFPDALAYMKENSELCQVLTLNTSYIIPKIPRRIYPAPDEHQLNGCVFLLDNTPTNIPTDISGLIFDYRAVSSVGLNTDLNYDAGILMLYTLLMSNPSLGYYMPCSYVADTTPVCAGSAFLGSSHKSWYIPSLKGLFEPLLSLAKSHNSAALPEFIQYAILYQLKWRFQYNMNTDDKHIIDKKKDEFLLLVHDILQHLDIPVLFNFSKNPKYDMPATLKFALLYMKYDGKPDIQFLHAGTNLFATKDNYILYSAANQKVYIDVIDVIDDHFIIEAATDTLIGKENFEIFFVIDGNKQPVEETTRYAHTKFFGISTHKRYTFRVSIPLHMFSGHISEMFFIMECDDTETKLPIIANRYTDHVNPKVPAEFWIFDKQYMLRYVDRSSTMRVIPVSSKRKIFQEIVFLKNTFLNRKKHSASMGGFRILYWLTYPFMRKKKIWLTYDKLFKGGDCGEYLYKYMCTRNDGVTPAYVMNGDCPDYKRLRSEGYKPLKFGSLRQRLYYVNASVVFTTHGGVHTFNAFTGAQISYIEDRLHQDVACIQHGLTVQQLAFNSNRTFNNMKRYYCASKYEIQNLSHPIYGYEDKSILKLTGIPRYDGLINNDKKQILITPTWRSYIAMPAAAKNQAYSYNPDFIHTDYFKIYNNLLSDSKLVATARKTGYRIIYLLHPVISAQIDDYKVTDEVSVVPAIDINYEKILTESSLMVTDYSGVQFDFAYMRKPIVYYHPPKLPPHYEEGGFFYDTMGFGEICTEHQTLVNTLCEYMENSCALKPFYKERQDDFFAFSDLNSCQRIYDDMLEYQKSKGNF